VRAIRAAGGSIGFDSKKRPLASIRSSTYSWLIDMETVTLSPKFQVVIPLAVREALGLTGGEKLRVISYADRVEFIPVKPMKQMRGFLRGLDTTIVREPDRL
jgi:AbrB family looped-hinge helix DNA binding protein